MAGMNIVKKLSMKVLCGNIKALAKPLEKSATLDIVKVVGVARGLKTGTSNFGDWTALTGDFVAAPLLGDKAGQQFRTGMLFLPDVALNLVESTVANLAKGEGVELAFGIGIQEDEESAPGYIYTAQFLVEPKGSDPVNALVTLLPPVTVPVSVIEDKNGNTTDKPAGKNAAK